MRLAERPAPSAEQRRRAIVNAARKAFLRHGFGATTMSAIATAIGGSKTTLWSYFPNKRALFDAVIDDQVARFGEALRVPLPPDGDPRAVLLALAQALIATVNRPEIIALHRVVIGEAARFPELGAAMVEKGMARGQARIGGWIAGQMARGTLRAADPALAAQQFGALCKAGSFELHLIGAAPRPDAAAIEADARGAVEAFLRAYAA